MSINSSHKKLITIWRKRVRIELTHRRITTAQTGFEVRVLCFLSVIEYLLIPITSGFQQHYAFYIFLSIFEYFSANDCIIDCKLLCSNIGYSLIYEIQ